MAAEPGKNSYSPKKKKKKTSEKKAMRKQIKLLLLENASLLLKLNESIKRENRGRSRLSRQRKKANKNMIIQYNAPSVHQKGDE